MGDDVGTHCLEKVNNGGKIGNLARLMEGGDTRAGEGSKKKHDRNSVTSIGNVVGYWFGVGLAIDNHVGLVKH